LLDSLLQESQRFVSEGVGCSVISCEGFNRSDGGHGSV